MPETPPTLVFDSLGDVSTSGAAEGDLPVSDGTNWNSQAWVHNSLGVGTGAAATAQLQITRRAAAANPSNPTYLRVTGVADTQFSADTEVNDVLFDFSRTVQWTAGGGAFTNQRAFRITAPTYAATGAETIVNAATLEISGAPIAGANMSLTNAYALWATTGASRFGGNLIWDEAVNLVLGTGTGSQIGTASSQKIGIWANAPVVRPAAYTQSFTTQTRTINAYTTDTESVAYTGAADGEAQLADLNFLRVAYENLRVSHDNLLEAFTQVLDDLQLIGWLA
jgi:hypothetical protein